MRRGPAACVEDQSGRHYPGENLQGRLTDVFKTRMEKVMFVKGDDSVPFADVANVIDIAHASGVDKVGLITAKIEARRLNSFRSERRRLSDTGVGRML